MVDIAKLQRSYVRQLAAARYWLIGMAETNPDYLRVLEAMEFAKEHHNGKRNGGGPEFMHQVNIFHRLRTLRHHLNDPVTVFMLAFLHDCIEDGQKQPDGSKRYITVGDISSRWGTEFALKLCTMSKEICGVKNPEYSLDVIFNDPDTALVKLADRADNISSMMGVFKRERAERYIKETEEEFIPRAKSSRRKFPAQEGAFENLKLVLNEQLALIHQMMPTYKLPSEVDKPLVESVEKSEGVTEGVPQIKVGMILAGVYDGSISDGTTNNSIIIGHKSGELLVKCKEDLGHFKKTTMNSVVIMGSKTFESIIGESMFDSAGYVKDVVNPLKGRYLVILSTRVKGTVCRGGFRVVNPGSPAGLHALIDNLKSLINTPSTGLGLMYSNANGNLRQNPTIWVAGGGEVYKTFLEQGLIDAVDLTLFLPQNGESVIQSTKHEYVTVPLYNYFSPSNTVPQLGTTITTGVVLDDQNKPKNIDVKLMRVTW